MWKIQRYINQNRVKIIIAIFTITFILSLIYSIRNANMTVENNIKYSNIETENIKIVEEFIHACYSNEFEKAYGILSNDCKDNIFQTESKFEEEYGKKLGINFGKKEIEKLDEDKYKITYEIFPEVDYKKENKREELFIDVYTVVIENGQKKLNINNYIGEKQIGKSTEFMENRIKVENKQIYLNYEIYNISIKNNAQENIFLDCSKDSTYAEDRDNNNYNGEFVNIAQNNNQIQINSNQNQNISLIIFKDYSTQTYVEKIYFNLLAQEQQYKIELDL